MSFKSLLLQIIRGSFDWRVNEFGIKNEVRIAEDW